MKSSTSGKKAEFHPVVGGAVGERPHTEQRFVRILCYRPEDQEAYRQDGARGCMRQIKEFLDEFFGLEIIPEPQRHSAPVCISITSDIPHEAARSLIVKGLIQLGVWMKEAGE